MFAGCSTLLKVLSRHVLSVCSRFYRLLKGHDIEDCRIWIKITFTFTNLFIFNHCV